VVSEFERVERQNVIESFLAFLLNAFVSVWLLKDDALFGLIHRLLDRACFQLCSEQCQGGMSCLLVFVVCNLLTILSKVMPPYSIIILIAYFPEHLDSLRRAAEHSRFNVDKVLLVHTLIVGSLVGSCIAQAIAAWLGWRAYKEAESLARATARAGNAAGAVGQHVASGGLADRVEMRDGIHDVPARSFEAFCGPPHRLGE